MNGSEMIANERLRQQAQEGWTPEHDDTHNKCELAAAATCYAMLAANHNRLTGRNPLPSQMHPPNLPQFRWPWDDEWWKPSDDQIKNLVKAGALIAAEIDRLLRKQGKENIGNPPK